MTSTGDVIMEVLRVHKLRFTLR